MFLPRDLRTNLSVRTLGEGLFYVKQALFFVFKMQVDGAAIRCVPPRLVHSPYGHGDVELPGGRIGPFPRPAAVREGVVLVVCRVRNQSSIPWGFPSGCPRVREHE